VLVAGLMILFFVRFRGSAMGVRGKVVQLGGSLMIVAGRH
jgi:hypothetical protein